MEFIILPKTGVYKHDGPFQAYIEITGVPELRQTSIDDKEILLGGGVTLTEIIDFLKKSSVKNGFEYASRVSSHLERVANVPVRNVSLYLISASKEILHKLMILDTCRTQALLET